MGQSFDKRNRLRHDGTSQRQRRLPELDPAHAPVDERGVEDFLAFTLEFSRCVKHWDEGRVAGSWEPFFGCDASAIIAAIEKTNPQRIRDEVRAALSAPPQLASVVRLFKLVVELVRQLDDWLGGVGRATDYRQQIRNRIQAGLPTTLQRLKAYNAVLRERARGVEVFDVAPFAESGWPVGGDQEASERALFGASSTEVEQLGFAKNQLEALFVPTYRVFLEVIGLAPVYFDEDLRGRSDHEPHFALFVAFLRLYLQLRDDANNLTRRHLDFFYEKVLRIEKRPAEPDHLHVLVELARNVEADHLLSASTLLDAGEDALGEPLRYAVDEDLVANKAKIDSFKTVFVDYGRTAEGKVDTAVINNVTAAPIANSQDGLGGEIEDKERPSWATLGSPAMPDARLGFGIASRSLLLAEGVRTITLTLDVAHVPTGLTTKTLEAAFEVRLSGAEGWIFVAPNVVVEDLSLDDTRPRKVARAKIKLTATLEKTVGAVTFADAEVLAENFGTNLPLLLVELRHPNEKATAPFAYDLLKDLALEKVTLHTKVDETTRVVVQNDDFVMDARKSFVPFGLSPQAGSNFYVGCREAFQKDLTFIKLHLTWEGLPEDFGEYYQAYPEVADRTFGAFTTSLLQDSEFGTAETDEETLFEGGESPEKSLLTVSGLGEQEPRIIEELSEWVPSTANGFLKLTLTEGFGQAEYPAVVTRQALAVARMPDCTPGAVYKVGEELEKCTGGKAPDNSEAILPNPPYTPTLKALTLSYEAEVESHSASEEFQFFHIGAFGYEQLALSGDDGPPSLLPSLDHEGTLYLGISGLRPLQSLSVLFQCAEATADADIRKPEVEWAYLADGKWREFKGYEIVGDATHGLISSGVITFSIPRDIATGNTILPHGLHWLRARVALGAGGVSELINAHAQAVRATLVESADLPVVLDKPLSAGSVGGLVRDDAAVAGVEQPYDSFGRRRPESGERFYTRVAEHLRHKGRAVTLFDYERLVLERFPGVYKVKCINHTNRDHELSPGHVMVAVIPDFTKLKAVDRRAPKMTVDQLDEIAAFLHEIQCPFVSNAGRSRAPRLHVLNPIYETVRVDFKVRFRPEVSAVSFYERELNQEIIRYLSPWAFADSAEISFGGQIYKSSILNLVEEQPYVDYVTDFVMLHDGGTEDLSAIEADTPRSILVPVDQHGVSSLVDESCPLDHPIPREPEIGQVTVGNDLVSGSTEESP